MNSDPSTWPAAPIFGVAAPSRARGHDAGEPAGRSEPTAADRTTGEDGAREPRPVRRVLMVCTGNVCRSPFAQLLLAARVPGLEVSSRGTFSLQGSSMDADMAAELGARGVSARGFVSRQLSPADLGADLILAMGPEHLAHIRDEVPAAARRAGLLGHVPDLAALVAQGGVLTTGDVEQWSRMRWDADGRVPDPFRRGPAAATAAATLITRLVEVLAPVLQPGGNRA